MVVGLADARAVDVGLAVFRQQEAARAPNARIGDAHARNVGDGHADDLEARVLEIDALGGLILDDTGGADVPGRHRVFGADGAGGGDGLVQRRVAVAGAVDLGCGDLELARDQHPAALDQPLAQVGRKLGGIGQEDRAAGIGDRERPGGADLVGGLVVGDAFGMEHAALVVDLDIARGGQHLAVAVVVHRIGDEARGLGAREPCGQREGCRKGQCRHTGGRCSGCGAHHSPFRS